MILRYAYHKPFKVQLFNKYEWQNGFNLENKGGLVWYTDGSKTHKNTLVLVCINGTRGIASVLGSTPRYSTQK